MKALTALLLFCFAASVAVGAEETRLVKVYTLKDGRTVIALRSIESTSDGKTAYQVTDPSGKKVDFDNTQVATVDEEPVPANLLPSSGGDSQAGARIYADFLNQKGFVLPAPDPAPKPAAQNTSPATPAARPSNVEPYTGPNLGLQPDSSNLGGNRNGDGTGGIGWWGGVVYLGSGMGRHHHSWGNGNGSWGNGNGTWGNGNGGWDNGFNSGPVIGLRNSNGNSNSWMSGNWDAPLGAGGSVFYPNTPAGFAASIAGGWNATLAQAGGVYIPNTAAGFAASIAGGYNATLAQAGGTYVPWNSVGGTIAANPNWPYTGNYYNTLNNPQSMTSNSLTTAQIMANAGSHFVPNNSANSTGKNNSLSSGGTCSGMNSTYSPSSNSTSNATTTHSAPVIHSAIRPSSVATDHAPTYTPSHVTPLPQQLVVPPHQPPAPVHLNATLGATHGLGGATHSIGSGASGAGSALKR
ncbi:MAG TPA: hypothetical protein VKX17_17260 [Planctomycetota bacterium]|nr:hypothetical protein [Planctomycetota bacterium]